jgi:SET domain-containing protein
MKVVSDKNPKDLKKHFRVIRAGKGLGLGLVTKLPFKKGDFVIEYIGYMHKNKEVEDHTGKYLFEINNKFTIDGSPRWNIARYINHSCKPNCEVDIKKGRIEIEAIKDIKAGEELTYDYGKEYFDEFIKPFGCKCAKCLGKK